MNTCYFLKAPSILLTNAYLIKFCLPSVYNLQYILVDQLNINKENKVLKFLYGHRKLKISISPYIFGAKKRDRVINKTCKHKNILR